MMSSAVWRLRGAVILAALWSVLFAGVAGAQTAVPFVIVACKDALASNFPEPTRNNLQTAIDDAVDEARDKGTRHTVWVVDDGDAPDWTGFFTIPADANITIRGLYFLDKDNLFFDSPWKVVVQGDGANPVFQIVTPMDTAAPTNLLVIEGLTLRGGRDGVHFMVDSDAVVSRCILDANVNNGVLSDSGKDPVLVNCAITNSQNEDGVQITKSGSLGPNILYCSILSNRRNGVNVTSATAKARVRNTLLYRNEDFGLAAAAANTLTESYNGFAFNSNGPRNPNVSAGPGEVTDDPQLLPPGPTRNWYGQISGTSPLIGKAANIPLLPYTAKDLEDRFRPAPDFPVAPTTNPDIGADEAGNETGGTRSWTFCRVWRNPIPAMPEGGLSVELHFEGLDSTTVLGVYIMTQGVQFGDLNQTNTNNLIPIRIIRRFGQSQFFGRNEKEIKTVVLETGVAGPSEGDVIADGHGAVVVNVDGIWDTDPASPLIILDEVKRSDFVAGRHVLIDTTAPRMVVSNPGLSAATLAFLRPGGVNVGTYGTNVGVSGFHPNGAPVGFRQRLVQPIVDDGLITRRPGSTNGTQAFFNVSSLSNRFPQENLDLQIQVPFEDPYVEDVTTGLPIPGVDAFTGNTVRQVVGFDPALPVTVTGEEPDDALGEGEDPPNPVTWNAEAITELRLRSVLVNTARTISDNNPGYFDLDGDARADLNTNRQMQVAWTFTSASGAGLEAQLRDPALRLPIKFRVFDEAGNGTPDGKEPGTTDQRLDPLHVWWLCAARTKILPNREGTDVEFPSFTWGMDRGFDPRTAGQPKPLFTYRIWGTRPLVNMNDPYGPLTQWSAWSPQARLTTREFADPPPTGLGITPGQWILITVAGADEAGNVEQWPGLDLRDNDGDGSIDQVAGSGGTNWQRFHYVGPGGTLDTSVSAFFWHDKINNAAYDSGESQFGAGPIVPLSASQTEPVQVRFQIGITGKDPNVMAGIKWELVDEGHNILDGNTNLTDVPGGTIATVVLPRVLPPPPYTPYVLGDQTEPDAAKRVPRSYIFRAAAVVDANGNGLFDAAEQPDPTPANFAFTVVPSVKEYIENKNSMDFQPVKVQEDKE